MSVNVSATIPGPVNLPIQAEKLSLFKHFPQPIFLLRSDMGLLETNHQGERAIKKHWIGLSNNTLHFNSHENNEYVNRVIGRLCNDTICDKSDHSHSERFVLRNIDMICRAYTLARESRYSEHLVLIIQGDLTYTDEKIKTVARAFGLSSSETKIVALMVAGKKPKEIAYDTGLSLNTVRTHLRTLYAKMQVRDYNEALTQAVRLLV